MAWNERIKKDGESENPESEARAQYFALREDMSALQLASQDMGEALALIKKGAAHLERIEALLTQGGFDKEMLSPVATAFSTAAVNLRLVESAVNRGLDELKGKGEG
ncbi:hypothetical protein [Nibribacter koreensis]|uniref:Uncharacterized protein n=1 Tax=Nibribacter koreensis TaxID=1084519 RepID=A0ABP8FB22_9BACT